MIKKIASTVSGLSADAVEKANSGHPGMPIGCAEIGALLYGEVMKYAIILAMLGTKLNIRKLEKWMPRTSNPGGFMILYSIYSLFAKAIFFYYIAGKIIITNKLIYKEKIVLYLLLNIDIIWGFSCRNPAQNLGKWPIIT